MQFLRITAADGTRQWIPMENVVRVETAADAVGASTAYAAGRLQRGLITEIAYLSGAAATEPTITEVAAIPAYTAGGILYEIGCHSVDGAFVAILSNRAVNY
jgi:hypothetical protein